MQTKKLNKKGFTLVELVVVIAVIAVLSAILIPTIGCFVEQAKETNDMATVRLLNVALVEGEAENDAPKTMSEVVELMDNKGYGIEKLTPRSSGDILWDSVYNRFLLRREKDDENLYYDNTKGISENYLLWRVAKNQSDIKSKYSNYLEEGGAFDATQEIATGLDVGKNTSITAISYKGTTSAQKVVICTNGGELTINAPLDTVYHYGIARSVSVQNVADNSYHVYGKVGFINVEKGRVVVESAAKVVTVYAAEDTAKIDNNAGIIENAYVKDGVTAGGNVTLVSIPEGKNIADIKSESEIKIIAVAKVDGVYQVSLEAAFTKALTMENAVVDLISDIDMASTKWIPVDMQSSTITKTLIINGNNHVINGLNIHLTATNNPKGEHQAGASNFYGEGFIGRVNQNQELTINNLTFVNAVVDDNDLQPTAYSHTSGVGVVVGISYGKTILNNVNVKNSSVHGGEKVGGFIGFSVNYSDNIINGSLTDSTISCAYYYSALVVGLGIVKPVISDIKVINNKNEYDMNSSYSSKNVFKTENGDTRAYVDGYWMMAAYNFAIAARGGNDIELTHDGITAISNGHAYEHSKNGDLYSIN